MKPPSVGSHQDLLASSARFICSPHLLRARIICALASLCFCWRTSHHLRGHSRPVLSRDAQHSPRCAELCRTSKACKPDVIHNITAWQALQGSGHIRTRCWCTRGSRATPPGGMNMHRAEWVKSCAEFWSVSEAHRTRRRLGLSLRVTGRAGGTTYRC